MPQFDSGAAEPIGRFGEGLFRRLLHTNLAFVSFALIRVPDGTSNRNPLDLEGGLIAGAL
jgi:hypothetical protein